MGYDDGETIFLVEEPEDAELHATGCNCREWSFIQGFKRCFDPVEM